MRQRAATPSGLRHRHESLPNVAFGNVGLEGDNRFAVEDFVFSAET